MNAPLRNHPILAEMYRGEPIWHLPNGLYHLDIGGDFLTIEEARDEIDAWRTEVEAECLDPMWEPRR